ncbi:hypothetical protein ACIA78_16995 [Streptomyces xanthochromogenes]|uniref:hypothetical protein n=1 Tax=Streptomyces xanthochromogenes TaxID=67384 RepID=UPI003795A324
MPSAPEVPAAVPWHFVLTMQFRDGTFGSVDGVTYAGPGTTRADVFTELRHRLVREAGQGGVVTFFTLEPNRL